MDAGPTLSVMLNENGTYEMLVQAVKKRFYVGAETMIALTYQFPAWMLQPAGMRTPPVDLKEDGDVELFMAVHVDSPKMEICVTIGPYQVERYLFQRRSGYDHGGHSHGVGGLTTALGGRQGHLGSGSEFYRPITYGMDVQPVCYPTPFTVGGGNQNQLTTCEGVDDAMSFWEGLVGDGVIAASEHVLREVCSNDE